MIIGVNRDEFTLFMYEIFYGNEILPPSGLYIFLDLIFGNDNTIKIWEYYNISLVHDRDTRPLGSQIFTDGLFHCPSRFLLKQIDKHSNNFGYFYHFNHQ